MSTTRNESVRDCSSEDDFELVVEYANAAEVQRGETCDEDLETKELFIPSLWTKFVFDAALGALAVGAILLADFEKAFFRQCSSEASDSAEKNCEKLNTYRTVVLGGSVMFLLPAITSVVEFAFITKKALLNDNCVVYHKGGSKLFRSMLSLMIFEYATLDAFPARVIVAIGNLALILASPALWILSLIIGKPPKWIELFHYAVSLPGMLMPAILVFLLYVLVRDAEDALACFSYAAVLQVYAYLGNWLVSEIFNRESSLSGLVQPFSIRLDSMGQALDEIATSMGKANGGFLGKNKWAVIKFPDNSTPTETMYLNGVLQCVCHFNKVKRIKFLDFAFDREENEQQMLRIYRAMPPGSQINIGEEPFVWSGDTPGRLGIKEDLTPQILHEA